MMDAPLHPVLVPEELLLRNCQVRHERRRGPGGQHRNKTESAVVLHHTPTGIEGQAAERRSQFDNLRVAIKRLRLNMALEIRSAELAGAAPTELWRSRCHGQRFACNTDHDDFAPLLAEALDVISDRAWHLSGAAEQLGISTSQLVKFLKQEPRAMLLVNQHRERSGLRPME